MGSGLWGSACRIIRTYRLCAPCRPLCDRRWLLVSIDGRQVLSRTVLPDGAERDWADRWLTRLMPEVFPTKSSARKAIKRGELAFDGALVEHPQQIQGGTVVERLEPRGSPAPVFPLDLRVIHEDAELAVVEKVPGFRVNGNRHRTIEHALPHNLQPAEASDALRRPRPCHRLDAPTGGLLVVAKTAGALAELNRQFQSREVHKTYRAIAVGRLEGAGVVDLALDGRDAVSRWRAVSHTPSLRSGWLTTVELEPVTGRTHQLRRHLAHIGHPILGDVEYGLEGLLLRGKGLFLWAVSIELTHPTTGERLSLSVDEPPKFHSLRARERRRWLKYNEPLAGPEG